jgi:hypothetical protein
MSTMTSLAKRLPILSLALVLGACSSTGLAESWVDPGLKELPHFKKVFIAYLGVDTAAQRVAEDSLAKHLKAREVVKKYVLYPDTRDLDAKKVREELRDQGCDGAILMRLVRVEQQVSSTPMHPADYYSFGGDWGNAYPTGVDVRTDEIVHVETNVYSLENDKILYSARSESFNPSSTSKLIDEIATAVAEDLEKRGLNRPVK